MMCWIFKAHNFNESEQIVNKTPFKFVMVAVDQAIIGDKSFSMKFFPSY